MESKCSLTPKQKSLSVLQYNSIQCQANDINLLQITACTTVLARSTKQRQLSRPGHFTKATVNVWNSLELLPWVTLLRDVSSYRMKTQVNKIIWINTKGQSKRVPCLWWKCYHILLWCLSVSHQGCSARSWEVWMMNKKFTELSMNWTNLKK